MDDWRGKSQGRLGSIAFASRVGVRRDVRERYEVRGGEVRGTGGAAGHAAAKVWAAMGQMGQKLLVWRSTGPLLTQPGGARTFELRGMGNVGKCQTIGLGGGFGTRPWWLALLACGGGLGGGRGVHEDGLDAVWYTQMSVAGPALVDRGPWEGGAIKAE